ncbi:MAG: DUF3750 domain-containing protein [Cytophagales bacterium]|nr:DUF3750 domain-containing protein [Cytophagales bacterium]
MDRKLTDEEKIEQGKKYVHPQSIRSHDFLRISYRRLIIWSVFILFLAIPPIVDTTIDKVSKGNKNAHKIVVPNPTQQEPIIQVYAARTWGPKGIFAVHSWIAMKPQGAKNFEVSQVIGWREDHQGNVLFRETHVPVNSWYGNEAALLLDLRGDHVESLIEKVDVAIKAYPWKDEYHLFPGPNSNTFVSWVGLKVPELGLDLPSTAIGKDWRPLKQVLGSSASGTGIQASLFGLLGTSIGLEEGLEINILGLNFELDLIDLAFELPLFGRFEIWYLLGYLIIWLYARKWIIRTRSKYIYLA